MSIYDCLSTINIKGQICKPSAYCWKEKEVNDEQASVPNSKFDFEELQLRPVNVRLRVWKNSGTSSIFSSSSVP
jgi:hypothetical protein